MLLPFMNVDLTDTKKASSFDNALVVLAERTGLEPATPGVTGRYSNQLNYRSNFLKPRLYLNFENWWRDRDLNPRTAINGCRFSRPVLSTTQPSLRC